MPKYYVDSNVFFYAKILDIEYGKPCTKIMKAIFNGEIDAVTSALTPIEVANALRKYGLDREDVKNTIDAILSLKIQVYEFDQIDVMEAIEVSKEFDVSPYDAVHVVTMKKAGVTSILSADRDFDKVVGIKRIDPKEY